MTSVVLVGKSKGIKAKTLDEMGHVNFLFDKLGLDEMGLDEMGVDEMALNHLDFTVRSLWWVLHREAICTCNQER